MKHIARQDEYDRWIAAKNADTWVRLHGYDEGNDCIFSGESFVWGCDADGKDGDSMPGSGMVMGCVFLNRGCCNKCPRDKTIIVKGGDTDSAFMKWDDFDRLQLHIAKGKWCPFVTRAEMWHTEYMSRSHCCATGLYTSTIRRGGYGKDAGITCWEGECPVLRGVEVLPDLVAAGDCMRDMDRFFERIRPVVKPGFKTRERFPELCDECRQKGCENWGKPRLLDHCDRCETRPTGFYFKKGDR